ncbi:class I SAM-dependent methyltransferase [Streptomyces sp. NPDC058525]|uniref:class I SAM-dependent methyltransferase n=1 Tax=Streptomyces sp. NPDC058525 TaxID=3346538 RepID=UPI00364FAE5D
MSVSATATRPRTKAWDGSEAGPRDAPVIVVRSPRALRWLLWQPGELGLAEAYIAGEIDTEDDLATSLGHVWRNLTGRTPARPHAADLARAARTAVRLRALGPCPARPAAPRARLRGRMHTTVRDRAAISHHYDLSNTFYELLLDTSMAYSCAYWKRPDDPAYTLAAWSLTLEERRKEFVTLVGEPTTRVWRLYLAGSRLALAQNRMGVDQILAVRPDGHGEAAMPGTPAHWYTKGPLA